MKEFNNREIFSNKIQVELKQKGFALESKSKGNSNAGYCIFKFEKDKDVTYKLQFTFTSRMSFNSRLQIFYSPIVEIIKKLDTTFYKNQGGGTFDSYLSEYLTKDNMDGYLNLSAGYPYVEIHEPFNKTNLENQADDFFKKILFPALISIVEKTDSLIKANQIINSEYPVKPGKNRLLTSVLCGIIPKQMIMSLLFAKYFDEPDIENHSTFYSKYLEESNVSDNAYFLLLQKVLNYVGNK